MALVENLSVISDRMEFVLLLARRKPAQAIRISSLKCSDAFYSSIVVVVSDTKIESSYIIDSMLKWSSRMKIK